MPPSKRRGTRCSYMERGRRCPFAGEGDPSLCDPHRIALAEVARVKPPREVLASALSNWLNGKPINVEQTIGAVAASLGGDWGGMADGYRPPIAGNEGATHQHARTGRNPFGNPFPGAGRQAPSPPPGPDAETLAARRRARLAMGFAAAEPLTADTIKRRKRELAKRNHPDRGGSQAKMAAIMDAADVLMAEVEEA